MITTRYGPPLEIHCTVLRAFHVGLCIFKVPSLDLGDGWQLVIYDTKCKWRASPDEYLQLIWSLHEKVTTGLRMSPGTYIKLPDLIGCWLGPIDRQIFRLCVDSKFFINRYNHMIWPGVIILSVWALPTPTWSFGQIQPLKPLQTH